MDYMKPESDIDSDIILIDNPPETISIAGSSPERCKEWKEKKQPKRKVQIAIDNNNHMETLRVTQKIIKKKRTKFQCTINISNIETASKSKIKSKCKRKAIKSNSIRRFGKNEYKLPTYERIVPICFRNNCDFHMKNNSPKSNCCQSKVIKANIEENRRERIRLVSPISSLSLSDSDITYEDVSVGDFPDLSSEDELDTLIKRTKEREKQFFEQFSLSSLLCTSSPLHMTEEGSTHSYASTHSKATLVLAPEINAYSPKSSPYIQDTLRQIETPLLINEIDKDHLDPYSPTDPTVTPPKLSFIGDTYEEPTTEEFIPINEVNGRANPLLIKSEEHDDFSDSNNVKTEIVEANCNCAIDAEEIKVKRESGGDFPNFVKQVHTENTNENKINVKRENGSDIPDIINHVKPDNVDVTNCNYVIKTEDIFVKLDKGSDINGNFDVNVKLERPC